MALLTMNSKNQTHNRSLLLNPLALFLLAASILLAGCDRIRENTEQQIVSAGLYQLRVTHHKFPTSDGYGGGIALIDGQWLIVSGSGSFRLFKRNAAGDDFEIRKLPFQVPINRDQFADTAPKWQTQDKIVRERFRVADVILSQSNGKLQLWISHHWWQEEKSCGTLRVSTAAVDLDWFLTTETGKLSWHTLYQAEPCLSPRKVGFDGLLAGGKMALSGGSPQTLYLTLGTHGNNGLRDRPSYAQDPKADWGKVMKIDLESGAASVFTKGHRNPQGIFLDDLDRIWLTEHGPRGGDELNLLEQGKNYGWPLATFGTTYDSYDPWPSSVDPGQHDDFAGPVTAWVPSIGVSDVIRLRGDRFPLWKDDLLVGTLKAESLYRIHIRNGHAIVIEKIGLAARIRDAAQGSNGEIVLWTDNERLVFIEPVSNPKFQE